MKYYANYKTNTNCMMYPIVSNNKKKLLKEIGEIAKGNQNGNELVIWRVYDENQEIVYEAKKRKKTRFTINNYKWL